MAWKDVEKDPRYVKATPDEQFQVKVAYYQNVLRKDTRYKPEDDEDIRKSFFGDSYKPVEPSGEVTEKKLDLLPIVGAGATAASASGIAETTPVQEALQQTPSIQAAGFAQTQLDRPSAALRSKVTGGSLTSGFVNPTQQKQWHEIIEPKLTGVKSPFARSLISRVAGLTIDTAILSTLGATIPKIPKGVGKLYTGAQGNALKSLHNYVSGELVKQGIEGKAASQMAHNMIWKQWQTQGWLKKFPSQIKNAITYLKKNPKIIESEVKWSKFNAPKAPTPKEPLGIPQKTFIGGESGIQAPQSPLTLKILNRYKALPDPNTYYRDIVNMLGGEYKGIQYTRNGKRAFIMFNDKSGTPLNLPENKFSFKAVQDKLASHPSTQATINFDDPTTQRDIIQATQSTKPNGNPFELSFRQHIQDITFTMQDLERATGIPFYTRYYNRLIKMSADMQYKVANAMSEIITGIKEGSLTDVTDLNVLNYIVKKQGTLNAVEKTLVARIEKVFRETQPVVKYLKLRRMIDGVLAVPDPLKAMVLKAEQVFRDQGAVGLFRFARKQKFGIIEDGYFPATLKRALLEKYAMEDPFSILNPHVESRVLSDSFYKNVVEMFNGEYIGIKNGSSVLFKDMSGIEFTIKIKDFSIKLVQEKLNAFKIKVNVLSRIQTYLKRVYSDFYMYDEFKDISKILKKKNLPPDTLRAFTDWARALKGFGNPAGRTAKLMRKARGQFMKTVFIDIKKFVRNLQQPFVFLSGKYRFANALKRLGKGYKLTSEDIRYINRYVSQKAELAREHFALYEAEKAKQSGIGKLAADISEAYVTTDQLNRISVYKTAMVDLEQDLAKYSAGKITFESLAKKHGLYHLTPMERLYCFTQPAKECAKNIARLLTEKVNGRYKLVDKGFESLTSLGEFGMFLVTYPKAVLTDVINSFNQIKLGKSFAEKYSGARNIVGTVAAGYIADRVRDMIFGVIKYYDPLTHKEKKSSSYNILNTFIGITFGGAQTKQIEQISNFLTLAAELVNPDTYNNGKQVYGTIMSMAKIADSLGEQFIPFLKPSLDVLEGLMDVKYYKVLSSSIERVWGKRSSVRKAKAYRSFFENISHAAFGTEREIT